MADENSRSEYRNVFVSQAAADGLAYGLQMSKAAELLLARENCRRMGIPSEPFDKMLALLGIGNCECKRCSKARGPTPGGEDDW